MAALMKGSGFRATAGTTLIAADTDHPFVYRLREGWACRTRQLPDGRDQFILIFLPGDFFAVKSMFVTRHSDDVMLLSDALVERIDYRQLHDAYVRDGDIASRCLWQVLEEERRLHNWVVGLGRGSAEERIALLLLDFRNRLAASRVVPKDSTTFSMPLTQTQLAAHLGLTAVHVNRVLKVLREAGIVQIREGRVSILSLDELVKVANPLLDAHDRRASRPQALASHESHM